MESVHDYVQWLFPSRRPSQFNPDAPVLTEEVIAAFRADPQLRERLLKSFERMLRFYGFETVEDEDGLAIKRASNWRERFGNWVSPGNHNHLRITRILACLRALGLARYARAFLEALEAVRKEFPAAISGRTAEFWRSAGG